MRYGAGIDLGTSFTSAAINGPDGTRMVPISPTMTVPSVAYPAPDGGLLTGDTALQAASDPTLVARNFKRRLGDPTPLMLGGSPYPPAALMAAQLRDVLASVIHDAGGPPESIVLTYPAVWGPYRREQFSEVPKLAGVNDFRLITEPEAAATYYSSERRLGDGEVVAVYDLGGGTFDTTVLRMRSGRLEILGTPEGLEHLGGIDFDEALLAHVDQLLGGAVSELDVTDPQAAATLAAIQTACVRAKEELSTEDEVRLTVPLPAGPHEVTVTRPEFNEMIRPSVRLTIEAMHRTTTSAGLRADDLSAVLLAGGSSRVPLVAELVAQEFNKPVRVTLHPKFTVALGAALLSASPRPANPAPAAGPPAIPAPTSSPPSPAAARPTRRRRWLVPALAAAVVILVGLVGGLYLQHETARPSTVAATGPTAPPSSSKPPASSAPAPAPAPATTLMPPPVPECPTVPQPSSNLPSWFVSPASSAAIDKANHVVLLARSSQGRVMRTYQVLSSTQGWSDWEDAQLPIAGEPVVLRDSQGNLEAFAIGTDGGLWENPDVTSGQPIGAWRKLGGENLLGTPAVARDSLDTGHFQFVLFARDKNGGLWKDYQTAGGWTGSLSKIGSGVTTDPAASVNAQGKLDVFAGSGGSVRTIEQTSPRADKWNDAGELNNFAKAQLPVSYPTVAMDNQGRLEVFVTDKAGVLQQNVETLAGCDRWSGWQARSVNDARLTGKPFVVDDQHWALDVFAVDSNNAMRHSWMSQDGLWNGWLNLGGNPPGLGSVLGGAQDLHGVLTLFAVDSTSGMQQDYQDSAPPQGQGWHGWGDPSFNSGGPFSPVTQ